MASVIKAGRVIPSGTKVRHCEFNLEDMSQTASMYLETVKQQAAQIVLEAQKQAADVLAQAKLQGRQAAEQEATKAALAAAETKWQSLTPALQQAIDSATQLKVAWIREWEKNVVHLVVAVAQRVIRGELSRQPQIPQQWIREALELATGASTVTLHLSPGDFASLGELREQIMEKFGQMAPAKIVSDPGLSPGGCRVVTDYGCIDQQIEAQLARIEEELTS